MARKGGTIGRREKEAHGKVLGRILITAQTRMLGEYNETYDYPDYDLVSKYSDPRMISMFGIRLWLNSTATELYHLERNRKKARLIFRR